MTSLLAASTCGPTIIYSVPTGLGLFRGAERLARESHRKMRVWRYLREVWGLGRRRRRGRHIATCFRPNLQGLECRTVPSLLGLHLTPGEHVFATGAGPGHEPIVNVYDAGTGALIGSFEAYAPRFKGGVNVAVADINGDSVPDIITGPGAGGGPDVRVFDGTTGAVIREFYAYDPAFAGGVSVAAGLWADKPAPGMGVLSFVEPTIITGAGPGGGPHVKVFNAISLDVLRSFYAYDPRFAGGVRVANGDFDFQNDVASTSPPM